MSFKIGDKVLIVSSNATYGGEEFEIAAVRNSTLLLKIPTLQHLSNKPPSINYDLVEFNYSDIKVSSTNIDEGIVNSIAEKEYAWLSSINPGDLIKTKLDIDKDIDLQNSIFEVSKVNLNDSTLVINVLTEKYNGKRYVPIVEERLIHASIVFDPNEQKVLEEEFNKCYNEYYADIEMQINIATAALDKAVELSELHGIPFYSPVSKLGQSYAPASYEKFKSLDASYVAEMCEISDYDLQYNIGWKQSQLC